MDEIKVISINGNNITLQHTFTIDGINNEHDLIEYWLRDIIDSSELDAIRRVLFPALTSDQFNEIASQIDASLNEEDY